MRATSELLISSTVAVTMDLGAKRNQRIVQFVDDLQIAPENFEQDPTVSLLHPRLRLEAAEERVPLEGAISFMHRRCRLQEDDQAFVFPVEAAARVSDVINLQIPEEFYSFDLDSDCEDLGEPGEDDPTDLEGGPFEEDDIYEDITEKITNLGADPNTVLRMQPIDPNDTDWQAAQYELQRMFRALQEGTGLVTNIVAIWSERCPECPVRKGCLEYQTGLILSGAITPPATSMDYDMPGSGDEHGLLSSNSN